MKRVDQRIYGYQTLFFSKVGKVCVSCSGRGAGMTENCLDMTKTQATFKQMSGEAVTKGMDGDFFLMPHSFTTTFMAF
jgi:hypothetical protein